MPPTPTEVTTGYTDFLSAIGSILSALVAIVALAYSYYQSKTSLKYAYSQADAQYGLQKYEVKRDYRNTIIAWFSDTTEILLELRSALDVPDIKSSDKATLLINLSKQIEVGRLHFPNIDKGDGFGQTKPKAFRGYRNVVLTFLVYSYDIFKRDDASKYKYHLVRLQREFTSIIYEITDPTEFLAEVQKHASKVFSSSMGIDDFLKASPENVELFSIKQAR